MASSKGRPASWSDSGSPPGEKPQGSASAGSPVMLNGGMLLRANGKSGSHTVAKDGAATMAVGLARRSTSRSTASTDARMRARSLSAWTYSAPVKSPPIIIFSRSTSPKSSGRRRRSASWYANASVSMMTMNAGESATWGTSTLRTSAPSLPSARTASSKADAISGAIPSWKYARGTPMRSPFTPPPMPDT